MQDQINQILQQYRNKIIDDSIFLYPQIPVKKIDKAIAAYASNVNKDEIIALIDNTVFGNASDGAVLTLTSLHVHNLWEEPRCIDLDGIESAIFVEGVLESSIHINDTKFLVSNTPKKTSMRLFTEMLREIAGISQTGQPEKEPVSKIQDALIKLKSLYETDLITKEEYEAKRKAYLDQL